MRYFIYAYFEPNNDKPFYVGKGCGDRHLQHLKRDILYKKNTMFYCKLRKMLRNGILPIVKKLLENLTEQEAFEKEKLFIRIYGRRDIGTGCLCNHTDGGEGATNTVSVGFLGNKHSIDARLKVSQASRKADHSNWQKASVEKNSQPVKSYNPITKETLKRFTSISEAARHLGCCINTLRKYLGTSKLYSGSCWDFCS